ncbi:hypothetical protein ACF3NG_06895 [Aerococcaceae bacterium WGS1372]
MELTSIYGEMFKGEIISELENVVIAEGEDGKRYVVHKEKLGSHKRPKTGRHLNERYDLEGTMMRSVMPKQMDRLVEIWRK